MKHSLFVPFFVSGCLAGCVGNTVPNARAETIAVSQLDLSKATIGWGTIGRNVSVEGKPLSIGTRTFTSGVGTHAPSAMRIKLDGKARQFTAWIGIDNEVPAGGGTVIFRLLGDGRELFRSPTMKSGDAPQQVKVDLNGVKNLLLLASATQDGNGSDHANWAEAQIEFDGAAPVTVGNLSMERVRLTPPTSPRPQINGARVFGVRPGAPLLFQIAATGQGPLRFSAKLPAGVKLNPQSGQLTGVIAKTGTYRIPVTVANGLGQAKRELEIRVGEDILLTPPMGWNSWYQMSEAVSDKGVREIAQGMKAKGLVGQGWTYVNIDDCWQGQRGGAMNALQPNERFPNMKAMCDFIHSQGMKAGIYSTPWMSTYAGFRGSSAFNPDGSSPAELPLDKRLQPTQVFGRYPGLHETKMDRVGPHWFFDRDARQFAQWGFDYVKVDWLPNDVPTTKRLADDLRASGRDIVLSLSNAAPFENVTGLSELAQAWRTTSDIHDTWSSIAGIANQQEKWAPFTRPGHWNDPDMLQIGNLATPNQFNTVFRPTRLTPDEQYFQVSLWSLLSAPLLLSCDIASLDDFTLGLITNSEVIAINQDALGKPAKYLALGEGTFAWSKPLEDGSMAVGLFNTDEIEKDVAIPLEKLGLSKTVTVRDAWRQKTLGQFQGEFKSLVNPHGVVLLNLKP